MDAIRQKITDIAWAAGRQWKQAVYHWHVYTKRVLVWWHAKDRLYGWRWRVANGALAVLILFGVALPVVEQLMLSNRYQLSADALQLVGSSDPKLQAQLIYTGDEYRFNEAALQQDASMRMQTGAATGQGSDTSTYALSVPQDFSKGTTYTDVNTGQSFQLIPQYSGNRVKEVQGHLVAPVEGAQAIYTLKGNGLKEDVVVPKATQDSMSFTYTLQLPKTLQAKVIPGSNGDIGIYSADPTLYSNVSASDSQDQAALQKARENGDKTNLVFGIPSPTIKTVDGSQPANASARFVLQGSTLSVVANGLMSIRGAFTIDPSVVVTSASDFEAGGNDEGMITFDSTNNQISRGGLTGGSIAPVAAVAPAPSIAATGKDNGSSNAQNIRLTVPSGVANGSLVIAHVWAGWVTSTQPTAASITMPSGWSLDDVSTVHDTGDGIWIADGWYYKYATASDTGSYTFTANNVGGVSSLGIDGMAARIADGPSSGNPFSSGLHTSSGGSGTQTVASFTPATDYSLLLGGILTVANASTFTQPSGWTSNNHDTYTMLASAQQSMATATGSLAFSTSSGAYSFASVAVLHGATSGGWQTTTSTLDALYGQGVATYNGYAYAVAGFDGENKVEYAPLNTNGTIGTWQYTTALPGSTEWQDGAAVAYNGYLYFFGGASHDYSTVSSNIYYARINSDGTVGAWKSQALPGAVADGSIVAYNGYLYFDDNNDVSTYVEYAPVNADGSIGDWTQTTNPSGDRDSDPLAAYNGYMYVIGGSGPSATVEYAPIKSDGSLGTWQATSSLPSARVAPSVAVYNGYLYVMGGYTDGDGGTSSSTVTYAPIHANGQLGGWQTTVSLSSPSARAWGTAVSNGYLYVIDGDVSSNNGTDTVQYAKIDPAGMTTAFRTATPSLASAAEGICTVAYNGYLYAIGGLNGSTFLTTVQYATLSSSGDIGTWQTTTALPTATAHAGCVASNGHLYLVGGETKSGTQVIKSPAVRYISINDTGGTLGSSWTSSSNTLPYGMVAPGVFTAANSNGTYLYSIGGSAATGGSNTAVYYSALNSSTGAVGTWTTSGNSLTQNLTYRGVAFTGKYMYAFGGSSAATSVEYASINSDGSTSAWQSTGSLNTAVEYVHGTAVNGCIYAVGGADSSGTSVANVQFACPNTDGTISAWHNAPSLMTATSYGGVTSYHGYLYIVGGYTTAATATSEYAQVNNGGSGLTNAFANSPGTWGSDDKTYIFTDGYAYQIGDNSGISYAQLNADGGVPYSNETTDAIAMESCSNDAEFALNGYIYSIGGYNYDTDSMCDTGVYSKPGSNGVPGAASSLTATLSTPVQDLKYAIYNGYVYLFGGDTAAGVSNTVYYAKPAADGNITSWTAASMPSNRYGAGTFAYDGYMYLVGGGNDDGDNTNTVEYAPINSNGSLGTWQYTSSINEPLYTQAAAVNGYVYILGGDTTDWSGEETATEYAPINSDGSLGAWQYGPALPDGVGSGGGVSIMNGYIYDAAFDFAPLDSIARTGHYSKTIAFGSAANITGITYNGSVPGGDSAVTYQTAGADGVFGSVAETASASGVGGCYGTNAYSYFIRVNVVLDDSYGEGTGGTFPDGTGSANLTDFTVNYNPVHPPPDIRLRTGQTLQSGALSPLDTCVDGNSSGDNGGGSNDDNSPPSPTVAWSSMTSGGGSKPSLSVPANTVQAGDVVVTYMTSEDGAQSLSAPSGSGTWTTLVSNLSETFWHHSAWQSAVLTSAQATAINGHTISGSTTHDSWSEVVAVVRGTNGTRDPAVATGSGSYVSSAPSTIAVSSMTPSATNRLALVFVDTGSDTSASTGNSSLGVWTRQQAAYGYGSFGDTAHTVALFSSPISSATGTLNVTTPWSSWSGNGGYGWISVAFAPST